MQQPDPSQIFDEAHASQYDERFTKLTPLREALNLLMAAVFSSLPEEARVLSVGAGTGAEILFLAQRFPHWRFTAVEPSEAMLAVCRRKIDDHGLTHRCDFHHGYAETLPGQASYDAATSILVSHFILHPTPRARFFHSIAQHLKPGGLFVNAELALDATSPEHTRLMDLWLRMMKGAEVPPHEIEKLREAYNRDVALWSPTQTHEAMQANGFGPPVDFFQAGLIHASYARRS